MAGRLKLAAQGAAVGLVVLLFALLVWRLLSHDQGTVALAVSRGQAPKAPAFSAPRVEGAGKLSLSSFRGKPVLVNFFASWCAPACVDEAPVLARTWREYRGSGLVVLGVAWHDFRSDTRRFMRRYDLTYPAVEDGSGSIADRWGVGAVPETYMVDREGRVVDAIIGSINTAADRARLRRAVESLLHS